MYDNEFGKNTVQVISVLLHYAMNQLYLFGRFNCLVWSVIKYKNTPVRAMQHLLSLFFMTVFVFCVSQTFNSISATQTNRTTNTFRHFLMANIEIS